MGDQTRKQILLIVPVAISFVLIVGMIGWLELLATPTLGIHFTDDPRGSRITAISPHVPAGGHPEWVDAVVTKIEDFPIWPYDLVEDILLIPDAASYQHWWKARLIFYEKIQMGVPLHLTILKNGNQAQVLIVPAPLPFWSTVLSASSGFFSGLISLLIGSIVILKRKEDHRACVFFAMTLTASLIFILYPIVSTNDKTINPHLFSFLWGTILLSIILLAPLLFNFILIFPRRSPIAHKKWVIPIIYLTSLLSFCLYQTRLFYLALNGFHLVVSLLNLIFLTRNLVSFRTPEEKAQTKWVLVGVGFATIGMTIVYVIPTFFQWNTNYSILLAPLFFLAIPLSMAFAITQYRLMDIDTHIDHSAIYVITLSGLIVMDMVVMTGVSGLKTMGIPISGFVPSAITVWLTVMTYLPVRTRVSHWVKQRFKRQIYNPYQIVLDLSAALPLDIDLTVILQKTMRVMESSLHPTGITAFLYQGNLHLSWPDQSHPLDQQLAQTRPFTRGQAMAEGEMFIPLNGRDALLGFFVLKEKFSKNLYTGEDVKLLEGIAHQTALAIERVYLVEASIQKESVARASQDRISRDIHDSIGGAMTNAMIMVDMISREKTEPRLHGVSRVLSEGLSDLRSLLWMLEETEFTLGSLMAYLQEKFRPMTEEGQTGVVTTLSMAVDNDALRLAPTVGLNIFRILQESLTNTIKHANATKIQISLLEQNGRLLVTVSDNGKGFNAEASWPHHYGLQNLKKRAEEIGASLSVTSEVGVGTTTSLLLNL